jgi:uncharacterized membrane protein YebE (DUF533 family)
MTPNKPSGRFFAWLHLGVLAVMLVLLPPTILWWKSSLTYISLMSWVAMAYSAISSWQAARVERNQEEEPSPDDEK